MAQLFESVFNGANIYETLFFNIKAVLEYPTLDSLKVKNPALFDRWKYISKTKYNYEITDVQPVKDFITSEYEKVQLIQNSIYQDNASYYPEYSRIVAITYGNVKMEDGELKRKFKKFVSDDEKIVVNNFIETLQQLSLEGVQSSPQYFPILCGYNVLNYDIPLLIKRFLLYRKTLSNKDLPFILKRALTTKPWESDVIDASIVWKFNGNIYENTSLMLISDFLGLKKTIDLLPTNELSKYYWANIQEKPKETLDFIVLQSVTQTNLIIQLMNELRQL